MSNQSNFLTFSIILLSIAFFQTLTPNPPSPTPNYIVTFSHYVVADRHPTYLESALSPVGWRWITCRNPAAQFPTDFALVVVDDAAVVDEIWKLGSVKYVSPDVSYKRGLMMKDQKKKKVSGAFEDGVKKRPGKIFTAISFCEAENKGEDDDGMVMLVIGIVLLSGEGNC